MFFRLNKHLATALITVLFTSLFSQLSYAKFVDYALNGNEVTINGLVNNKQTSFLLRAHHPQAIETVYPNTFHQQLPSFSIAHTADVSFNVTEHDDYLNVDTGMMSARINKQSLAVSYYRENEFLIAEEQGYIANKEHLGFRFFLSEDEQIMGGGERVLGMNRRGHKLPLYNKAHYGYTTESKQMYFGLPALMSDRKYVVIFDNTARGSMDIGATESNVLAFDAIGGRSAYIIVAGGTYPKLINNYVDVTGKQPMPPRWALGNFASRFGYHSEQEVRDTAQAFIDEDMPLDAIVLDLFWFGKDIQGHMGNLAWDKQTFPTPELMIKDLADQGVNTVVITEPFILTTSNNWSPAVNADALAVKAPETSASAIQSSETLSNDKLKPYTFDFYFGNTGLVDVFNRQGQDWFNQAYETLYKQGVKGWWGDLGEPEVHPDDILHRFDNNVYAKGDVVHNVYGHQWAKMVFEQQQALAPNTRPMVMMRSGFVGSQRYGMIPWTGDVSRSWGGLKPQVELSLQMGLFGLAYTHSDLGGFAGGETFDAPMYTRWLQYGTFQPVYRPHAQESIAPEPVFHDQQTKDIVREFIKLRYQLLPYNYTLAYENSLTGMPLMRPLFFEDEQNAALLKEKSTYLWGDAFLVTPVTDNNVESVSVNVPKGVWFDFFTDEKINGGNVIQHPVTLATIPVMVRAGSFVPMINPISSTSAYDGAEITLHYYHDRSVKTAKGKMYEDDGQSFNAMANKNYDLLEFNGQINDDQSLTIEFSRSGNGYHNMPNEREFTVEVHHWQQAAKQISIDGTIIPILQTKRALMLASQGALWDEKLQRLTIKLTWQGNPQTLVIQ